VLDTRRVRRRGTVACTKIGFAVRLLVGLSLVSCVVACTRSHDVGGGAARESADARGGTARTESPDTAGDASGVRSGMGAVDGRLSSKRGGDPDDYVFSQNAVRNYEMEVDPQAWDEINQNAYLEQYIEGTLRFEGKIIEHVGIRFKGFRGSLYNCFDFDETGHATKRTCSRLPIKLGFDAYDDEGRFYGLKKLNFHVMRNDRSMMHDRVSYFVFRAFGVAAPRAVHATLSVNGEPLGLFALIEEVDGRFARHAFDEGGEGNLYKERWPALSTDGEYFASGLESNRDLPDVSAMQELAEALTGATDETIEAILREHTNFDALMRYFAVDRALNHWDGPLAFRCQPASAVPPLPPEVLEAQTPPLGWETCQNKNFYWYEEAESGRVQIVPWDLDVTWGSFSQFPDWTTPPTRCEIQQSGRPPRCDRLINWLATVLRPHYVQAGQELLTTGPLRSEVLTPIVEGWYLQLAPFVDPASLVWGAALFNGEMLSRTQAFFDEVTH
jgi:spore coat protein H